MAIFHEIYGVYYRIVRRLLCHKQLTVRDVQDAIRREGFRDSVLFLPGKILPQEDGSDWGLLRQNPDGTLSPVTAQEPPNPLSFLQKRWLRTILDDSRMALFLTQNERDSLRERLNRIEPLYTSEQLHCSDQFTDGDQFGDALYQKHFREILAAIRNRNILDVSYRSGHGNHLRMRVVPFCIEYSEKNDKLRVYCIDLRSRNSEKTVLLNLGRILSLHRTAEMHSGEILPERCFARLRCSEPVTVRVTPERNAPERFLMEFASYEKRVERDAEANVLTVQLWYDINDRTELLIQLLSFGPVLEILSPTDFRAEAAERIRQQCRFLK